MSARKSGYFRHPQTRSEHRQNSALRATGDVDLPIIKGRIRRRKTRNALPDAWDDLDVAARKDRARGKPSHSPARKAKAKRQWR